MTVDIETIEPMPLRAETFDWQPPEEIAMNKRFRADTEGMKLRVLMDNGLYRHLSFVGPRNFYGFNVITYPGRMIVDGAMGTFVFSREDDMLRNFFTSDYVNTSYWAEKTTSISTHSGIKGFDQEILTGLILSEFWKWSRKEADNYLVTEKWQQVKDTLLNDWLYVGTEDEARAALNNFRVNYGIDLDKSGEAELTEYTAQFLWSLHAALWAAQNYRVLHARE